MRTLLGPTRLSDLSEPAVASVEMDSANTWLRIDDGVGGEEGRGMDAGEMRLVILESPFAGDVDRNIAYARECVADCLRRGEAPIASHLLYTQPGVLDDTVPRERALGIAAGRAWFRVCEAVVFYVDLGLSPGMEGSLLRAAVLGIPIEKRRIRC